MSERMLNSGCGEGFAGWRGLFCAPRIVELGVSGDGADPVMSDAIHALWFRSFALFSDMADGAESVSEILAYTHVELQSRKNCGLNVHGLMVAINWCDDEAERFALGASAVT